ncbi:conserved hypothetical protein [Leishmania braziliensis MHOM/BR/75/M2904]|uniref:Uncharacterized protein n=1 Tax=Leishmania braziliensis TaxID=5660 RepID=A4HI94_LEIBR|nr:conserved hypothetical protein [Leishmania braziliensis MHOM/BR/75/M2904]KAI5689737.1 hypothetical protein MNV84_05903 [Leishmania braziliensis]CAJ2477169.1 unnamed protein product [Leishmania braziliensis]CAM40303.1 conserved hypothetical protein [Leishmania braziliensis MHOM/BR/75/M2904]
MRRLVCIPSYYCLATSWRAFLCPFHAFHAGSFSGACRLPHAVRHYGSAQDSNSAHHGDHGSLHLSPASSEQRLSSSERPPLLCDLHTQATDSENRADGLGSTTGVPAERLLSSSEGFGLEDKDEIDMTFDGNLEDGGTTSSGRGAGVCGVAVRRAPPG